MTMDQKKVGIAVTDELQMIASPLTTVASHELFPFLRKYLEDNEVECFVLGEPRQADGSDSEVAHLVKKVKSSLENKFPKIPVILIDERFTSAIAQAIYHGFRDLARRNVRIKRW